MKYTVLLIGFLFFTQIPALQAQEEEFGLASYYSDDFQGRTTAYGEVYDKDQLTCAHKRHAPGTMLRVTRLDNKKSVTVKVNDKGPFIKGRVVDLSRRAAEVLGIVGQNDVEVKVERVGNTAATPQARPTAVPAKTEAQPRTYEAPEPARVRAEPATTAAPVAPAQPEVVAAKSPEPAPAKTVAAARPAKTTTPTEQPAPSRFSKVGKDYSPFGLYRITLEKPNSQTGFGVQVALLTSYENVLRKVAELQAQWFDNVMVSIEPGKNGANTYKVILGPFDSQKSAQRYQASLLQRYKINGFVLDLAGLKY